jgi:hypothetical protein
MKNAIMLVMFLSVIIKLNAQESVEKNQVKINFLLPSISYEKALSSKSTLYSEFGMSFGIYKPIYEGVVVLPFLNEEFRKFFCFECYI